MKVDRKLRREVSNRSCVLCGRSPCDPHHFIRRSHLGEDVPENLLPLCHPHHRAFHDGVEWVVKAVNTAAGEYFDAR